MEDSESFWKRISEEVLASAKGDKPLTLLDPDAETLSKFDKMVEEDSNE